MYVSTFDKDLLASDFSIAKVLKHISAVGRRTTDISLVLSKSFTKTADDSHTERLLRYLAEIGENGRSFLWINLFIVHQCGVEYFVVHICCSRYSSTSTGSMLLRFVYQIFCISVIITCSKINMEYCLWLDVFYFFVYFVNVRLGP